jgi:hypothetical protein
MALLPASQLALLSATILGVRVYHLATIGFALLFGAIAESIDQRTARAFVVVAMLVSQAGMLCHNLLIWRDTALLAGTVCRTFPQKIDPGQPVVIANLPRERKGVFFLANGFPACVYVNSGKMVTVAPVEGSGGELVHFGWDDKSEALVPIRAGSK